MHVLSLPKKTPGGTLCWGSQVWDFRFGKKAFHFQQCLKANIVSMSYIFSCISISACKESFHFQKCLKANIVSMSYIFSCISISACKKAFHFQKYLKANIVSMSYIFSCIYTSACKEAFHLKKCLQANIVSMSYIFSCILSIHLLLSILTIDTYCCSCVYWRTPGTDGGWLGC